jgi:hypothetical protein
MKEHTESGVDTLMKNILQLLKVCMVLSYLPPSFKAA